MPHRFRTIRETRVAFCFPEKGQITKRLRVKWVTEEEVEGIFRDANAQIPPQPNSLPPIKASATPAEDGALERVRFSFFKLLAEMGFSGNSARLLWRLLIVLPLVVVVLFGGWLWRRSRIKR
jgi:hypothetical protein